MPSSPESAGASEGFSVVDGQPDSPPIDPRQAELATDSNADEALDLNEDDMSDEELQSVSSLHNDDSSRSPSSYVWLTTAHCRKKYHVVLGNPTNVSRRRVEVGCGRLQCKLRGHDAEAASRAGPGYYLRLRKGNLSHCGHGHRSNTSCSAICG